MVTHKDFNAEVIVESTTARTLLAKDTNKLIRCTNGSATTLTVAPDATAKWGDGAQISIMQGGAGQVTVAAGSGVTLRHNTTAKSLAQYTTFSIKRVGTNEWLVYGERAAS